MLRLTLFLVALALIRAQDGNSRTCYVCASMALKSRWEITGLTYIGDGYFMACDNPQGARIESCPGACMTMIFEDPDDLQKTPLYVRGCHTHLAQSTSDRSSNQGSYCEKDQSYPMATASGTMVNVNMLIEFCTSSTAAQACNNRQGFTSPACEMQSSNLLNNQPISCYDCVPKAGANCKDNRCANKKYCLTRTVWMDGAKQLAKTCSNVNIAGRDNACMSNDVITSQAGVPVKSTITQCFCKDKNYCNPAAREVLLSIFTMIASFLVL